jgi:acyl carrier protein
MEMKNFIRLFAEQFDDVDASTLTPETNFREIQDWSSLVALSVIVMVDEEFGVLLKGDDIRDSKTISDLFSKIETKKQP